MRILVIASLLGTTACTMQTDVPTPRTYIAAKHPSSIWVNHGNSITRLDHPHLVGDSIVGTAAGVAYGIPLPEVSAVAIRQTDWQETMAAVGMSGGLALVLLTALHRPGAPSPTPCGLLCESVPPNGCWC